MTLGPLPGYRFFFFFSFLILSLIPAPFAFADADLSPSASFSSSIWTLGFAGLGILVVGVALLTVISTVKALQESAKAKKESSHHAPVSDAPPTSSLSLSFTVGISTAFAVFAVGALFVVFLFLVGEFDLSSTKSLGSLLVTLGFTGFGLLVLFLVFQTVTACLRIFKGPVTVGTEVAVPAAGLAAVGVPLNPEISRRSFLSLLGWAWVAFTAASLGAVSTCLRFFFPNVTYEPPLKFKAGFPDTYSLGVDERYKDAHRVWIVRTDKNFYALSTICTHLGCTPNWLLAEQKFKCPCHGSGFYVTGINFEGPAPRPLERFMITLADDGQIEVDESVKFQYELGQWNMPGSSLEYKA